MFTEELALVNVNVNAFLLKIKKVFSVLSYKSDKSLR